MSAGINALKSRLPKPAWTDDAEKIAPHLTEWRDKYFGDTPLMLTPGSTAEVSDAVKICAQHGLKIVPQGGNTGLVGGQTPKGEILLTTKRLRTIREVNNSTNSMVAESGVTLQEAQQAAINAGRKYPLSLASEGSCTVGGTLSTNAGGVHVLKYGTTKDLVYGVEAVLPNGEIYNGLTSLRKDNTGYDLSRLFLGAEGTLGIITAASLKLFAQPGHIQRVMLGVDSPAAAMAVFDKVQVGNSLAMFEVIPAIGFELVLKYIPGQRDPFAGKHPWYILLDWEVGDVGIGETLAETCLPPLFENGTIKDAVIAQNDTQAAELLALREHMSAAQKFNGGSIKQDITVPLDRIPEFFRRADAAVQHLVPGCRPVGFGHFGDGNIHYNIAQPLGADKAEYLEKWQAVSNTVFDIVDDLDGSISAEHGIGTMKREDLAERAPAAKLAMMRSLKAALDPENMMNPRVMV